MNQQFWLRKAFAETKRLVIDDHQPGVQDSGLRVYRSHPDGITVQWRVRSKGTGGGTITHGTLTFSEARQLAQFILSQTDAVVEDAA